MRQAVCLGSYRCWRIAPEKAVPQFPHHLIHSHLWPRRQGSGDTSCSTTELHANGRMAGFEPATTRVTACSAARHSPGDFGSGGQGSGQTVFKTVIRPAFPRGYSWLEGKASNPRPAGPKPAALPTELPSNWVGATRMKRLWEPRPHRWPPARWGLEPHRFSQG